MYIDLGFVESYSQDRVAELIREADRERLAQLVIGPGRPIRSRVADWLVAIAERIEGRPGSIARAEA